MKNLLRCMLFLPFVSLAVLATAQSESPAAPPCEGSLLLTPDNQYYGGFEAGADNLSSTTGASDLYYGLPRNGSYEVVQKVKQLGGGGYLNIQPHSGTSFLAAHTSNTLNERVWFKKMSVTPGDTYNFCAWVTLLKNLGHGANFMVGIYANNVEIGTGRVTFDWTQVCGSYTVPQGVTEIEFSLRDVKKGLFFLATDDICISSLYPFGVKNAGGVKTSINEQVKLSVVPNPTDKKVALNITTAKKSKAAIVVTDISGKVLFTTTVQVNAGSNMLNLEEVGNFASGVYNVLVKIDGQTYNQRLVLAK